MSKSCVKDLQRNTSPFSPSSSTRFHQVAPSLPSCLYYSRSHGLQDTLPPPRVPDACPSMACVHDGLRLSPFIKTLDSLSCAVWIFDISKPGMLWGNTSAIEMWNAESLEALLERDFSDMSETAGKQLTGYLKEFEKQVEENTYSNASRVTEIWTFYPKGI